MMTRGRGGVWLSPENDDVIYEQPLKRKEQEFKIRENSLGDSGSRRDLITLAPGWPWVALSYSITSLPWTTIPCLFNQRDHTRLDNTKLCHTEADHRCHIINFC